MISGRFGLGIWLASSKEVQEMATLYMVGSVFASNLVGACVFWKNFEGKSEVCIETRSNCLEVTVIAYL